MRADDPRHGTTRGYAQGCKETCCREAQNTYERTRRKRRQVLGIVRTIPAVGTQRRIRALMALGWTAADIAARCGWTTPQAVTELTARRYVYQTTAATVEATYRALSMTPGPSAKNRRAAARKGWPPPLAWDCIDTDEHPRGVRGAVRRDLLAEWAELRAAGESIDQAAGRLGVTVGAIKRAEFRRAAVNETPVDIGSLSARGGKIGASPQGALTPAGTDHLPELAERG